MDQRELLEHYRPWLLSRARAMTSGWRVQDLAQEAWIEMWRRLQDGLDPRFPQDLMLKMHAEDRMRSVLRNWRSIKHQTLASIDRMLDAPEEDAEEVLWHLGLVTVLDQVELAYHRGALYAALGTLTRREREYVYLRFWCGWQLPQMREHFGYNPSSLWRTSRIKLQRELAPLASLL